MNRNYKQVTYVPHPIGRFPQLFSATPEKATDLERYHRALGAAVRFDSARIKGISECSESHNLLKIIQKEILRDAAVVAFSQAVQALEKEHKEVVVAKLCAERDEQVAAVEHFRTEVMALRRACEKAVNQCFTEESQQGRQLLERLNTYQRNQRDKYDLAIAFAEETGRPASQDEDGDAAQIAAKIAEAEAAYTSDRQGLVSERDTTVATLKRTCEETAIPLWSQYTAGYQHAQSVFQEAYDQSKLTLSARIKTIQETLESNLQAAQAQIDSIYAPFFEAAQALNAASQAFADQMKALRTGSAHLLSSGIGDFFKTSATR